MRLGLRWVVEGTNSWLSNYGQLRRNTDRRTQHRHAQLCLASALLITAKRIDWRTDGAPNHAHPLGPLAAFACGLRRTRPLRSAFGQSPCCASPFGWMKIAW